MIVRPKPHRAVASLAWGAVFFVALAGIAQLVLPGWLDKYADPPYTMRRDRLRDRLKVATAQKQSVPLVITLGSSRVLDAIDGRTAEQQLREVLGQQVIVSNFGTPACGPYHSLTLLGRLLRDGIQPDMVVVEVLPTYLQEQTAEQCFPLAPLPLTTADRTWLAERGVKPPTSTTDEAQHPLALYGLRTNLLKVTVPSLLPRHQNTAWLAAADEWGTILMQPDDDPQRRAKALSFAKQTYHPQLRDFQWGEAGLAGLQLLIEECHRHNIATAVLLTPEGPTFRTWYRSGAVEEIEQRLHSFAREHNTRLIVSSQWIEEADFADSHHLLAPGAAKFSARLGREGIAPAIQQRQSIARATGPQPTTR